MTKIYVMACGCRLKKSDLVKRVGYTSWICLEHKKPIDYIEKRCVDCNIRIKLTIKQTSTTRCDKCRLIKRKADKVIFNATYHNKKRVEVITGVKHDKRSVAAAKAWDCAHRAGCMDKIAKPGCYASCLPCLGCNDYIKLRDYKEAFLIGYSAGVEMADEMAAGEES